MLRLTFFIYFQSIKIFRRESVVRDPHFPAGEAKFAEIPQVKHNNVWIFSSCEDSVLLPLPRNHLSSFKLF